MIKDVKISIAKLTDADQLIFTPNKFIRLQMNYQSFISYIEKLGFTIQFHSIDCLKVREASELISKCVLNWSHATSGYHGKILILLLQEENTSSSFDELINECNGHLEFIRNFKIYNFSLYKENNEMELSFNMYSNYLINRLNTSKKTESTNNIKIIEKLNDELKKPISLKPKNIVYNINQLRKRKYLNVYDIDEESMIMNSFYNGTSENFGF